MQPHEILQAMYESEINCRVQSFFDAGWTGDLGDDQNGFPLAPVSGETFFDCVAELAQQARAVFPTSAFAMTFPTT